MKRLLLLRHAKSSWAVQGQPDKARPLNKRGRAAAPAIGSFLVANDLVPQHVMCSTSVRTRETMDLLANGMKHTPETEYRDDLYLAEPKTMLAAIHSAPNDADHLMLIGHNPGTEMLSMLLADPEQSDITALARISEKYPTAALAVILFDASAWKQIDRRRGALTLFLTPKDIGAAL